MNGGVKAQYIKGEKLLLKTGKASVANVYDPQQVLVHIQKGTHSVEGTVVTENGHKTFFVQVQQGRFNWWMPVSFAVVDPVVCSLSHTAAGNKIIVTVRNNAPYPFKGNLTINPLREGRPVPVAIPAGSTSLSLSLSSTPLVPGTNVVRLTGKAGTTEQTVINWDVHATGKAVFDKVDLSPYFNDDVTRIFKNEYLSPRPVSPTLQLPTQGIGNWCYPLTTANINDSGLRVRAGIRNEVVIEQGVPFATPSAAGKKNIVFTSLWDNYPHSVTIPLKGKAAHAYFLMAGSTNPMQSRFTNGEVTVRYKDGSEAKLTLRNPENWWPIEQDYEDDSAALTTNSAKAVRIYLKSGTDSRTFHDFVTIRGFSNRGIDGGAATVLDLPLSPKKELHSMVLHTTANDVVIGLMSVTLVRSW